MPGPRQVEEQLVHLDLGADVDAARRLVDDQHLRPQRQPAGQHDLLLVSARQVADACSGLAMRMLSARRKSSTSCSLGRLVDEEAPARSRSSDAMLRLMRIGERQEQRLLLAVLGHQADAVADGVPRRADRTSLAVDDDAAGIERIGAEDRARHLGAAGADQPGDAEDLAAAHFEADTSSSTVACGSRALPRRRQALDG